MILGIFCLHANLTINIPFDPDVIGPAYNDSSYIYVSEYFSLVNNGVTDHFTIVLEYGTMPPGWSLMFCHILNGSGACHMPIYPWNFNFASGDTLFLDFTININSAGSMDFTYTITAPSLTEPVVLDFTYTTGVSVDDPQYGEKVLLKNSPNPFSESTTISFNLKNAVHRGAEITIYNLQGKRVKTYNISPDINSITWNGNDEKGSALQNGVYLYTISLDDEITKTEKLLLLK
jgi:hypothetical protein